MSPTVSPWSLSRALSLLTLLAAPLASGQARTGPFTPDAPVRLALATEEAGVEFPALRAGPPMTVKPEPSRDVPRGSATVTPPKEVNAPPPVSAGAWAAYGTTALLPLGGIYGASRLGQERLWVTTAQTASGSLVGALPGSLLFLQPAEAGGRWAELDVAAFGAGLVLTPPAAALGTWGLGELAFGGSQHPGRAFLGSLGGAAAGMLLGVAMHGVLEEVVGNSSALRPLRKYIALGFVGSGATLGYQWAGGGPRPRIR